MCLSIPSKVVKIDEERCVCTVDTMGVQRDASLNMMEDGAIKVGDYVLLHVGFVMNKISEEAANSSLEVYREILQKMDEEDRRETILKDDNCENRT